MSRSFDFVVKAEKVVIKEKGDNNYKVKLAGVGDFLKYQVWSKNNINGDRSVFLLHAKDWVEQFNIVNSNSDVSKSFTPTTVIEIDNKKYVTIITNAEFKNKKVIFHMSTDDVIFNSKKMNKMNKLPKGEFYNVRFDIDDSGLNQACYNQCIASPDLAYIEGGIEGNVVDACTNISSGASSCVSTILSTPGAAADAAYYSLNIGAFCSNINAITPNSDPSAFENQIKKVAGGCSIL